MQSQSHLICTVANKCFNVREAVEAKEMDKTWFPSFSCCPVSIYMLYNILMKIYSI